MEKKPDRSEIITTTLLFALTLVLIVLKVTKVFSLPWLWVLGPLWLGTSLDVETEVQIQTGLNHLIQGKTVIVISHRLKSIENADKIVVMKAGTVEACGKHAHLLKQSSTYRKMIEKSNLAEKFNY